MKLGQKMLLVSLFFFVLGLCIYTDGGNVKLRHAWEILFLLAGGVAGFLGLLLCYWYGNFRSCFGASSPNGVHDWKMHKALKNLVVTSLQRYAISLSSAIKAEEELLNNAPSIRSEMDKFQTRLECVSRNVARAKKDFWNAHKSARSFGFLVRASYKDYLIK